MTDVLHIIGTKALLRALDWRPLEYGVMGTLSEHPGRPMKIKELADSIYGAADGGPINFEGCIRVIVCRLRQRGVPIQTHCSRGYSMRHA